MPFVCPFTSNGPCLLYYLLEKPSLLFHGQRVTGCMPGVSLISFLFLEAGGWLDVEAGSDSDVEAGSDSDVL